MELKLSHFLVFRCFCTFFIRTFYNPDEYYQSMELAHKMAFGYGVKTWEWDAGVRSFFYPVLISIPYRILGYFKMDDPYLLLIIPRLMHAVFVAIGEYMFYKMTIKSFGKSVANWTVFLMFINWYVFILSPRTLTNTVEMGFLLIVLSMFPYRIENEKKYWSYLVVCTVAFYMRCTSAVSFVPIGLYHIFKDFANFRRTLTIALPISLAIVAAFISLDSYQLGKFTVSPWTFVEINILKQASRIFGTEAFHFYLTSTLPKVLLTVLPLFVFYLLIILSPFCDKEKKLELRILSSVLLFNVFITSLNPHKEDRFILPIIPVALLIAAFAVTKIDAFLKEKTRPLVRKYLITWFVTTTILANGFQIIEKGLFYEYGRHAVVDVFRDNIYKDLKELDMQPSVLFLGECYGYPLTSVMHRKYVETRYVSCKDQDYFLRSPNKWVYQYIKQLGPESDYITHIIVTANQLIWNMYNLLYATGFTGDVIVLHNGIPDYKYRGGGDSLLIKRDFSVKKEWWYYNETTSKWVFNYTVPPDFINEKENGTVVNDLKERNSSSLAVNAAGNATVEAINEESKTDQVDSIDRSNTDIVNEGNKEEKLESSNGSTDYSKPKEVDDDSREIEKTAESGNEGNGAEEER